MQHAFACLQGGSFGYFGYFRLLKIHILSKNFTPLRIDIKVTMCYYLHSLNWRNMVYTEQIWSFKI